MKILKVLSLLMDYPSEILKDNLDDIRQEVFQAEELSINNKQSLGEFLDQLQSNDLMNMQAQYGGMFDRGRSLSLLLFEHVHGESRDRGQAMVDLMNIYERHGFLINKKELPDYLPLFLEYLSHRPFEEVKEWLADISHILAVLSARLKERDSHYSTIFDALLHIAESTEDITALQEKVSHEERDDTPEAMDKIWEEEAVRFGQDASTSCSTTSRRPAGEPAEQVSAVRWVDANNQAQINH